MKTVSARSRSRVAARTALPIGAALLVGLWGAVLRADDADTALRVKDSFTIEGREARLVKLETLPLVENDFTRRFQFDRADNPKLKLLREQYQLDAVVAPGRDEFDRQVLLLDWVNHRFKKFGAPSAQPRGAAEILRDVDQGHTFFCAQYADVLVSAAASLGWIDRSLALRRPADMGSGSSEHSSTEIWSNQFGKWVMFDPTFAMFVEKDGQPLSAYELRQEWFYRDAKDLVFVLDKDRKRYRKSDMPVLRQTFAGFGDLVLDPGATLVYAFIGWVPNTNLMDAGPDYGRMFIFQDALCAKTQWHQRVAPTSVEDDCYFPINQASLALRADGNQLRASLKTLTPNFKTFRVRFDQGSWQPTGQPFAWKLQPGHNRLEVQSVNQFDVPGPTSVAEVDW